MFALMFLGLVASASTAAWFDLSSYNKEFQENMDRFWDNFHRQMNNLNDKIKHIVKYSKNRESRSRIDGDEYKISIFLTGFNKEDIVVKVKNGNLVIQAIHNAPGESANNYLFVRDLPDFIDNNGSWSYNNGILTIIFPIIQLGSNGMSESLLYVNNGNDIPSKNKDPDEDVIQEYFNNSYDTGRLQIISPSSEYDYEDAIRSPENDLES